MTEGQCICLYKYFKDNHCAFYNICSIDHNNSFSEKGVIVALKLVPYLFKKIIKQTNKNAVAGEKNWFPDKYLIEKSFFLYITV